MITKSSIPVGPVYQLEAETKLASGEFGEKGYRVITLEKGTHFILYEVVKDWGCEEVLVRVIAGEFFGSILLKPGRYKRLE